MDFLHFSALFGVAALAGAINSVAGGGTFLTFPLLIAFGLTPIQANVTSCIALWPGSVASAAAYRKIWLEERHTLPTLMIISVLGGLIGAAILLLTPEQVFSGLVPWLLLVATLIFTFGRHVIRHLRLHEAHPAVARGFQFTIALYGGYFGAGIGILMLAMLQVMGMHHIHRMNALKAVLGAAINAASVAIFLLFSAVVWPVAAVMTAGAVAGGYLGAAVAQKLPPEPVRWFVSAVGFAMTGYFFVSR